MASADHARPQPPPMAARVAFVDNPFVQPVYDLIPLRNVMDGFHPWGAAHPCMINARAIYPILVRHPTGVSR